MRQLIEEIKNDTLEEIKQYIDDLYAMRKEGLAQEGEYSVKNNVFREVRNRGYLDNLKDLKNQIVSKELSLKDTSANTTEDDTIEDTIILNDSLEENDDELTEELTIQDIYSYKREIQKYTHFEPIVQHSGRFDFYNLRESDADSIIRQLRGQDFIEYIQKTPGKYDFASAGRNLGMPARYYNVFGFIKTR